jgi:hypothetical protein
VTTDQIGALSTGHGCAEHQCAGNGLTTDQAVACRRTKLGALSTAQFGALSTNAIAAIETADWSA